ncbi:cytoplasmic protein-related [Anaeramoeba ignava]|uniref:Cytoplasmic protein-related n=1 Tax=Anaeramoeba ignava TaxID=1746090 RepID=A0A9Q0LTL6_ANAIG|nr:cytoplasmic protein-related [Anaeramoeba ignava]
MLSRIIPTKPIKTQTKTIFINKIERLMHEEYKLRKKQKEMKDRKEIEEVIEKSKVCRLGLSVENKPYVVPMSFGYANNTLYFHSNPKGKKMEYLKKNSYVCFEFDSNVKIVEETLPCHWTCHFESVIGYGHVSFVEDVDEKKKAMDIIMKQYGWESKSNLYDPQSFKVAKVFKLKIDSITGKKNK